MIVDDLDSFRRAFSPDKAQSPLVVDPDAVLTLPVAVQCIEAVSWDRRQVLQPLSVIQHSQLSPRDRFNVSELAAVLALEELLGLLAPEGTYQMGSIPRGPLNAAP